MRRLDRSFKRQRILVGEELKGVTEKLEFLRKRAKTTDAELEEFYCVMGQVERLKYEALNKARKILDMYEK